MTGEYPNLMSRRETTDFLGRVLVHSRLDGLGACWSAEVMLGARGTSAPRVDYLQFEPENRDTLRGIEGGTFTGYEVKSCRADLYSGHGLNLVGDRNFIVMPPWTWFDLRGQDGFLSHISGFGVLVPRFTMGELVEGREFPTSFLGYEPCDFTLKQVCPPRDLRNSPRTHSTTQLLFWMLRAGRKGR